MKLFILLMTITGIHVGATGLGQGISLSVKKASLESVILDIRVQSNYDFLADAALIHKARPVTVTIKNATIEEALTACFKDQQLTYSIDNNIVVIRGKLAESYPPLITLADTVLYSGKITDEKGETLQGVTVAVKGTSSATNSDQNGSFTIRTIIGKTLQFSFVGYLSQEIRTGAEKIFNVRLVLADSKLNEVVVTALGIKKEERKIGYAVSTVKGDVMDKARESNIAMSLEGRVAGLNVSGVNGGPGSSARILLRGAASQTASSPLYVINGVPMDNTQRGAAGDFGGSDYGDGISNINPDDIETMTVLKGSAASALYGARAANGVILLTTKTGSKSSRVSVEYNTNLAYDKPIDNTDFQYEYGMGRSGIRSANQAAALLAGTRSWGGKMDGSPQIAFNGQSYPYSPVKDNTTAFYRTAPAFTNTVSASGGSDKGVFRISLSNLDYKSVLPNSGLNRKTFDMSAAYNISSKLKVSFNGNYIDELNKNRANISDFSKNTMYVLQMMATSLDQKLLAPGYNPTTGAETEWNSNIYATNPYFITSKVVNNVGRKRFISSTSARYQFNDWIFLQARLGYDVSNDNQLTVTPTGILQDPAGSLGNLNKSTTTELNTDVLFGLNHKIFNNVTVDFSAGANYRKRQYDLVGVSGSQWIIPDLFTPSNLRSTNYLYNFNALETQSLYYTADFNYKNFLTIGTTGRYDEYSTLPSDNRKIFVPAVSASFLFSELTKVAHLSYGKLRVSYAQTSGEPADPYTTFTSYGLSTPISGVANGTFSRSLVNLNLKPFTTNEFEVGVDLKWFGSRLALDVAYFNRTTKNEISNSDMSITSGYTSQYVNLGKTENKGIEIMLSGTPVVTKTFNWNSSFNITNIHNKVLDIDGVSQYKLAGRYRPGNGYTAFFVGMPALQIMAYDYKRDAKGQVVVGNDGIPLRGILTPMGNTLPTVYGGFTNEFNYKNVTFSFLIDYKFGNKVLSMTEYYAYWLGKHKATLPGRDGGVTAEGVNQNGQVNTVKTEAMTYYQGLSDNVSGILIDDGRFIKFRQATLGYTFNQSFMTKTPFRSIAVNVIARNLFTILKKAENIDPEAGFNPSLSYAGLEAFALPLTHTYGVNVNFKFK